MENNEGMQEVRRLSDAIIKYSDELLELLPIGAVQLPIKGTDKYVFAGTLAMIAQVLPGEPYRQFVEDWAAAAGWERGGDEGAFEYVRRISYELGQSDMRATLARQSPAPEPVEVAQEVTQQAAKADPASGPNLYRKTALVSAEQFLPAEGKIPAGVMSDGLGDPRKDPHYSFVLDTKEGRHTLRNGDYICTGPAGEKWNVERSIFESTYELVDRAPTTSTVSASGADGSAA